MKQSKYIMAVVSSLSNYLYSFSCCRWQLTEW